MNHDPTPTLAPGTVPPLNARLCRRLAVVSVLAGAGFLLVNAILWLVPDWAPLVARWLSGLQEDPITLTPAVRWMGLAVSTLYLAILVRGLWVARELFVRLAGGNVFEVATGVLLRRFGRALVVYALLAPFIGTAITLLITMHNPPHQHVLRFGISDHEVVLAIVGTLVLTTGSVMAEAARLAAENRAII